MNIRTKFELFDTYEQAEAAYRDKNIFICENFEFGCTVAIHYSWTVKQFLDRVKLSRAEIQRTHENLVDAIKNAIRHGKNSGEFDMFIKGVYALCR